MSAHTLPISVPEPSGGLDHDKCGYWQGSAWPPTAGAFSENGFWGGAANPELETARYYNGSSTYISEVALIRFDTSVIPDEAIITAAALELVWTYKSITDATQRMIADYYDFGGDTVVAADWIEIPSPQIIATPIDMSGITLGVVTSHPLSDLSGINLSGFTGIRINHSAGAGTPTGDNQTRFATVEHATYQEPRLIVQYEVDDPIAIRPHARFGPF